VSLGLGSVIASAIEVAPWLMLAGRHKTPVFAAVGVMLGINGWLVLVRPRHSNCAPGDVCHVDSPAMRVSRIMFWASVTIWVGAVTLTYAAPWWLRVQP
jgi:hypothetical protein